MDGISKDTLKSYEIYLSRFSDYLSPETYPIYQNRVSKMNINESISENFRKLSCGLMQQNYPVVYKAHKNLYEIGQPVVPILKEKDQEKEADRYAFKIMRKNHPFFFLFVAFLSKCGLKCNRDYYRWGLN